uniref:C-type lectin domain-containing protein n=1 Tax=Xiphophorus maculatus TaxID=8083 RepID=M4ATM8_XIPMA
TCFHFTNISFCIPVCSNCSANIQQSGSSRRSKVTPERLVLLGLIVLLAAALIMNSDPVLCSDLFEGETRLKCEAGWEKHGGSCYYFSTTKSSWINSRRFCVDLGSDLVKIDSREDRLRGLMVEDDDKFWIGLTDSVEEGRWFWVDGSPLDERLETTNENILKEPDDWKGENPAGEDCVRMGERGGSHDLTCWFDKACNVSLKSICEKPAAPGRPCV